MHQLNQLRSLKSLPPNPNFLASFSVILLQLVSSHYNGRDLNFILEGNLSYAIEFIRQKRGKNSIEKFANMCFGHFPDVHTLKFCSTNVLSLLIRQMECDDLKMNEFNFRVVSVRFDKKAFALVTRLKCGKPSSNDDTSRLTDWLWMKYFDPNNELQLREFIKKFECHLFDQSEVDENVNVAMFSY
ncbi:hypothetical protein FNV43_RR02675 [Rhamnella rubrinervis]|uniref:Uncharacterized protein n=1 Tax=Rhamnella rubrinervis TaxID=2594499 RepID=A0A8K0HRV8_9ROSA|nr:hypothetical protein FNV43_RR02675 [Rhamnella rubrinervis]